MYEAEESWSLAAQTLAGIELDSGQRVLESSYKLDKCVKIAQLYLEDDDALSAETFIKKAAFLVAESNDKALERAQARPATSRSPLTRTSAVQFNVCYARILDAKVSPSALLRAPRPAHALRRSDASWKPPAATTPSLSWRSVRLAGARWRRRSCSPPSPQP